MQNVNNNSTIGTGLVKRVASNTATPATSNAARTASYGTDNLVRNAGATAATAATANASAAAALDRLANAYHEDPAVFCRNLAEATLNDVCRLVG